MNPKIEEIVWELRLIIPALTLAREVDAVIAAADLIEQLQQELIDERYRHDRYADFCVAQGEELSACKSDMTAYAQRKIKDECDLCKHSAPREFCREADYRCALCNHTKACVCALCQKADQFEWRGAPVPEPPKEG